MQLPAGGMDAFYIDESMDPSNFVLCSVAFPFLRTAADGWHAVWDENYEHIRTWRRHAKDAHGIPLSKELHGQKLASGRGRYLEGKHQLSRSRAAAAYVDLLQRLSFLPPLSIIGVVGNKSSKLYDGKKLQALLLALFQRMRTFCEKSSRIGFVFFDEGHGEYRKLYRRARRFLPTGSSQGGWESGSATKNMPLDNFTKDANIKQSQHSNLIQIADLVAYALRLKIAGEQGTLAPWQKALGMEQMYDQIPRPVLNIYASAKDPLGIVRL